MHRQADRIYKMSENTIKHHGYIEICLIRLNIYKTKYHYLNSY